MTCCGGVGDSGAAGRVCVNRVVVAGGNGRADAVEGLDGQIMGSCRQQDTRQKLVRLWPARAG